MEPWIGVDLDGTLAEYTHWQGPEHIGKPIPAMVKRVKIWLASGHKVRIFTARVWGEDEDHSITNAIQHWCLVHLGEMLPVTCQKDYGMLELWDDRAVEVIPNTGRPANPLRRLVPAAQALPES